MGLGSDRGNFCRSCTYVYGNAALTCMYTLVAQLVLNCRQLYAGNLRQLYAGFCKSVTVHTETL